jgi:hypothetical protein
MWHHSTSDRRGSVSDLLACHSVLSINPYFYLRAITNHFDLHTAIIERRMQGKKTWPFQPMPTIAFCTCVWISTLWHQKELLDMCRRLEEKSITIPEKHLAVQYGGVAMCLELTPLEFKLRFML